MPRPGEATKIAPSLPLADVCFNWVVVMINYCLIYVSKRSLWNISYGEIEVVSFLVRVDNVTMLELCGLGCLLKHFRFRQFLLAKGRERGYLIHTYELLSWFKVVDQSLPILLRRPFNVD